MMAGLCRGSGMGLGGQMGASNRPAICPVCRRRIGMRPGRAGRLYDHKYRPRTVDDTATLVALLLVALHGTDGATAYAQHSGILAGGAR